MRNYESESEDSTQSESSNEKKECQSDDSPNIQLARETRTIFFFQSFIPFILAGCGMVAAGILFNKAICWEFLSNAPEALILIPALLGIKGNLGMTLASRLATMVHLDYLDTNKNIWTAFYSNICLDQAQAIVVALFAALYAATANVIFGGNTFDFHLSFCVIFASILTASIASFIMACLMVLLAIISRRLSLNPDNIATPIAAALGDLISLGFFVLFGSIIYPIRQSGLPWLILPMLFWLCISIFCMCIASRVSITRHLLLYGWFVVITSMFISSIGGSVLQQAVKSLCAIELFQPVINGIGGNLVAIQASRISTHLHKFGKIGSLPANGLLPHTNPLYAFCSNERESQDALILLAMSIPGHLFFTLLLILTNQVCIRDIQICNEVSIFQINFVFVTIYICAAILQIAFLLYICQLLCRILWRLNWNPDNNSIPLLTALGDLFGTCLLALAFMLYDYQNQYTHSHTCERITAITGTWTAKL